MILYKGALYCWVIEATYPFQHCCKAHRSEFVLWICMQYCIQNWAPHTCIWQGFDKKYSVLKAYNLKGFIPNHEDVQKADV